jgi:hypothetical protein
MVARSHGMGHGRQHVHPDQYRERDGAGLVDIAEKLVQERLLPTPLRQGNPKKLVR